MPSAADGDDKVRAGGEQAFRACHDAVRRKRQPDRGVDQRADTFRVEMARKAQHAFGDPQILGVADERDAFERMRHKGPTL